MMMTHKPVETSGWPTELIELYRAEYAGFVRLAFLLCRSAAAAEEIVQDAFVDVRARWDQIRSSPGGYVRSAVVNGARGRVRRWAVEARLRPDPPPPAAPLEEVELWDALGRLSWAQRSAIVMRYWADIPDEQTAELLRCQPATVRSHIARGVKRLRKEMA